MRKNHRKKVVPKRSRNILPLAIAGIGLIVLGVVAAFLLSGASPASSPAARPGQVVPQAVDYPAPPLALVDVDGQSVALADYDGQVVLLNNWATWCPPCLAEMPELQAYHTAHQEQGFTVIAVEAGDPASQVGQFVEEYGLTFPVWVDTAQQALNVFRNLALPNSFVIDREGQVRLAWSGAITLDVLEKYVTPLLEE